MPDVPGEIRTPDRTLRRRMLYPAELLGHCNKDIFYYISQLTKCQHFNKKITEERVSLSSSHYIAVNSFLKGEIDVLTQAVHPYLVHKQILPPHPVSIQG